jgi:hypothetical protein
MLAAPGFPSDIASSAVVSLVAPLPGMFELQLASAAMELQTISETKMMLVDLMMRTPILKALRI